jgi:photosystem II stability/assembly factor-like uncharacterized protein
MDIMKWRWAFFGIIVVLMIIMAGQFHFSPKIKEMTESAYPNEWFYNQRAFPHWEINYDAYYKAVLDARAVRKSQGSSTNAHWEFVGPDNIGGRITDIELSPNSLDTIYAATASGGIFRSADRGQTWQPIFDEALNLSVGDIVLDPLCSRVLYAGTGEVNGGGGSLTYGGSGIYKSTDGGETWYHLGLDQTRFIARIVIDPADSRRIFTAAMGKLFAANPERGLYRSTDGGATWANVLFLSDSTGCIDVVLNPDSPDTLFAAMWERIRRPHTRSYGGVTSGLFRSTDGGDTWIELTNGLPHNASNVGRIGITVSASNPDILYAIYADDIGEFNGVYRTTNGGDAWSRTNDASLNALYSSFGWWFGNIRVDPSRPNVVFALGLDLYKSTNGGQSWFYSSGAMHVDQHGLIFHPQNVQFMVAGNDGGVYMSWDGGSNWTKSLHLPITQFYTCEIDYQEPQRLYGGTQDNGTIRTLTGESSDWHAIYWGDGFYVRVDPGDNRYVYAEYQWGRLARSTDGGISFLSATSGISSTDRNNWNSPLVLDPVNPEILYFGTHRVYKSTNRAQSWTAVSPDLSNGPSTGNSPFGTITTIDVSPADGNVIYAGTDDGNVWVTTDGGSGWSKISEDLPVRWITSVAADPWKPEAAYVTLSGYRWDEYLPHIFRTTDYGESWTDISGNLPEAPVNDVIVDPCLDSTLYIASDVGVFYSTDCGILWLPLGSGLPNVPVVDMTLHSPTRTLAAATYGRSIYSVDLSSFSPVHPVHSKETALDFTLFQNYPNPFNAETTITYRLMKPSEVVVRVFNPAGQHVITLVQAFQQAGLKSMVWDGTDDSGRKVGSGLYMVQLRAGKTIQSRKMELLQ